MIAGVMMLVLSGSHLVVHLLDSEGQDLKWQCHRVCWFLRAIFRRNCVLITSQQKTLFFHSVMMFRLFRMTGWLNCYHLHHIHATSEKVCLNHVTV